MTTAIAERDLFSIADIEAAKAHQRMSTPPAAALPEGAIPGATPGCYAMLISNEDYHSRHTHLSHSGMLALLRSPKHYKAYLNRERDDKPNLGTAIHTAILEPERFTHEYVAYLGRRQGKIWEAFEKEHAGGVILNKEEMKATTGALDAVMEFDEMPLWAMLRNSQVELSIFWHDPELDVPLRIRPDALHPLVTFDLKSIDDARPDRVRRQMGQMEYDLQAALYMRGVQAFTGRRQPFVFAFVEDREPHGVWLHTAGQSVIANGNIKLRRAARAFKRLQETGDWHGYRNASTVIEMSKWDMEAPDLDEDVF